MSDKKRVNLADDGFGFDFDKPVDEPVISPKEPLVEEEESVEEEPAEEKSVEEPMEKQSNFSSILAPTKIEDDDDAPSEFVNLYEQSIKTLKLLLEDISWMDSNTLDRSTCASISETIDELLEHDGKLASGKKSRDGFVMHNCPKYENAPIHLCVDCEFWKGGRRPTGTCNVADDW